VSEKAHKTGQSLSIIGCKGRETIPTTVHLNTEDSDLNSLNSGTVPTTEQFQQFHERVPTIPLNSPNVGTRNLSKNLSLESKNKKDWLCSKKLREEITLADDSIEPETLMTAKWLEREKRAFEIYNQDKSICDELLNFYFADWLLHIPNQVLPRNQNGIRQNTCSRTEAAH
jgi:hypothetical protein